MLWSGGAHPQSQSVYGNQPLSIPEPPKCCIPHARVEHQQLHFQFGATPCRLHQLMPSLMVTFVANQWF